jgi:transposase-like protein
MGTKQRWLCLACGKRFVNEPMSNIKGNTETVITAIDLYMKGVSYRGIADTLRQLYGLRVTHSTVINWVASYMQRINAYVGQFQPNVGNVWHADEQFIKVKGNIEYVWNVLDSQTRFLLAANESPTRNYEDARATFQQAKATAGKKARVVITDGSFNYTKAVRKEFATYENPNPHSRYVSIRARSPTNNPIERFHGSFRQRDKVMRGFKTRQAAFAQNFQTYYNFVRQHQKLGVTPAQKAGLTVAPEWRELLINAVSHPQMTTRNSPTTQ